MIRITVEMLPGGDEDKSYVLAQGVIVNDGKGTKGVGNYTYGLTRQVKRRGVDPGIGYEGSVQDFPRQRLNVWHLLRQCLNDAL